MGKDDGARLWPHVMHPALEPFTFRRGNVTVRNRTVLAAMTNKQSHDDGTVSEDEIRWLTKRSQGQFGIITTAATHVLKHGQGWEGEFGTWSDHHLEGLTTMAQNIRNHGALSLAQLFHGGMRAPERLTGRTPRSASANALGAGLGESVAMTESDIQEAILGFGAAARRCELAGFDGVELHGAHGYLIAQFLGAGTNRRTDEWGGSQFERTRFLQAIVEEVRRQTDSSFLVGVRLSPELKACGMSLEDSLETLHLCGELDLDFIHVSAGTSKPRATSTAQKFTTPRRSGKTVPHTCRSSPPGAFGMRMTPQWRWSRAGISSAWDEPQSLTPTGQSTSKMGLRHPHDHLSQQSIWRLPG